MNKLCTDFSQSKRLIELGIDVDTADSVVTLIPMSDGSDFVFVRNRNRWDTFSSIIDKRDNIPAWSLTALLELIPPYLGEYSEGIDFGFGKAMNGKWYSAHYIQLDNSGLATFSKTVTGDTSVDAAFAMVCWLKETGKI